MRARYHTFVVPRGEEKVLDVLVSGSAGLIGSALVLALQEKGHQVRRLTRSGGASEDTVRWDPAAGEIDADRIEGVDAVVHLAGENIMGRWTNAKKARIRDSRVRGTRLLAETLARLPALPGVMVSASAAGYYGDRGNELLSEESAPGKNVLAEVCQEWEAAADPARQAGVRVVHPRFGIVLSTEGGALATTLPIFKLGGGGEIGTGNQYRSWVATYDEGAVNVTVSDPPTNAEYTRTLGYVLGRPTFFSLPALAARIMLGQVADELLLASQRIEPARLKETGYSYRYPELEGALRHLLG